MRRLFCLALALCIAAPAAADPHAPPVDYANTQLRDPAKERAASALMHTLRCVVCQGQSVADSDADMAGDMRALVRRRIAAGQSAAQVRHWLIARYGDYITYDPPFDWSTAPLWLAPVLLIALGFLIARGSLKRRRG